MTSGLVNFSAANNFGSGTITLNGGGLQWATGTSTDISGRLGAIGSGGATFDTNGNNVTFASALTGVGGDGGIVKTGAGTLTLTGANTYRGGTTVSGGLVNFSAASNFGSGADHAERRRPAMGDRHQDRHLRPARRIGSNGATFDTNGNDVTFSTSLQNGSGSLTKTGSGTLTINNGRGYTGAMTVLGRHAQYRGEHRHAADHEQRHARRGGCRVGHLERARRFQHGRSVRCCRHDDHSRQQPAPGEPGLVQSDFRRRDPGQRVHLRDRQRHPDADGRQHLHRHDGHRLAAFWR